MSFQPLAGISVGEVASRPRPGSRLASCEDGAEFDGFLSGSSACGSARPGPGWAGVPPRRVTSRTRARPRMAPRAGKREEVGRAGIVDGLNAGVSRQRRRLGDPDLPPAMMHMGVARVALVVTLSANR